MLTSSMMPFGVTWPQSVKVFPLVLVMIAPEPVKKPWWIWVKSTTHHTQKHICIQFLTNISPETINGVLYKSFWNLFWYPSSYWNPGPELGHKVMSKHHEPSVSTALTANLYTICSNCVRIFYDLLNFWVTRLHYPQCISLALCHQNDLNFTINITLPQSTL